MEPTLHNPDKIQTWNEIQDENKLIRLAASMAANGWVGAPIVITADGGGNPIAITGSHRIPAARLVEVEVPAVDLGDLLAAHGASLADLVAQMQECGLERVDATYEVIVSLTDVLPAEVVDYYGIDAH